MVNISLKFSYIKTHRVIYGIFMWITLWNELKTRSLIKNINDSKIVAKAFLMNLLRLHLHYIVVTHDSSSQKL